MSFAPIMKDINSVTISKLMELTHQRQRVIANNIANVDTPGYIRREFRFEDELARILSLKDVSELKMLKGQIVKDTRDEPRLDGNNVKSAKEMNLMMQNGILYNLLSRAYNTRVNILRSAISTR